MREEKLREIIRDELDLHLPLQKTFSTKEAADYLKLSPGTLAKYRCQGFGPAYSKDMGMIVYTERDLKEYLAAKRVRTGEGR